MKSFVSGIGPIVAAWLVLYFTILAGWNLLGSVVATAATWIILSGLL